MNEASNTLPAGKARVAVPSEHPGGLQARRSGHFGRAECFTVVDVTDGQIGDVSVVQNAPHTEGGCMMPVMLLSQHGVNAIVVDGIGGRPLQGFGQVGITVHAGVGETVDQSVRAYAQDLLPSFGPEGACQH
jgi:predicted Fe-Mo cluster-binding NifX family protein